MMEDVVTAYCMKALQVHIIYYCRHWKKFSREGRIGECFAIFDSMKASSQDFHVQNTLNFYRTIVELRLAINRYNPNCKSYIVGGV